MEYYYFFLLTIFLLRRWGFFALVIICVAFFHIKATDFWWLNIISVLRHVDSSHTFPFEIPSEYLATKKK